jgi:hypothetical protein
MSMVFAEVITPKEKLRLMQHDPKKTHHRKSLVRGGS